MIGRTAQCTLTGRLAASLHKGWNIRNHLRLFIQAVPLFLFISFQLQFRYTELWWHICISLIGIGVSQSFFEIFSRIFVIYFFRINCPDIFFQGFLLQLSGHFRYQKILHLKQPYPEISFRQCMLCVYTCSLYAPFLRQLCQCLTASQCLQDPVHIGRSKQKTTIRQSVFLFLYSLHDLRQLLIRRCKSSGKDQFLFGTGQRHIKHAKLLAKGLLPENILQDFMIQRLFLCAKCCMDTGHADTKLRVQRHHLARIRHIKAFAKSRHEDNREFQTLTVVDTHDPHHISLSFRHACLTEIHLIFLQTVDIPQEMKQATVAALFIFSGLFHQHQQIGPALTARRHGTDLFQIAGSLIQLDQQFSHGCV